MAKHSTPPRYNVPTWVRPALLLTAGIALIFSIIVVFVTDGSRAYAGTERPSKSPSVCSVSIELPSTFVMHYDNSERPLPNKVTAKVKANSKQCATTAYYNVVNENAEVMATFVVKPFAKRVHFTLYPGSGTQFFAHSAEAPTVSTRASSYVLGMGIPTTTHSSNTMQVFFSRVGANP